MSHNGISFPLVPCSVGATGGSASRCTSSCVGKGASNMRDDEPALGWRNLKIC